MADRCDVEGHDFQYGGVRYRDGNPLPGGSGAREREYFEVYFCRRCLNPVVYRLSQRSSTYGPVLFGATPLPEGW